MALCKVLLAAEGSARRSMPSTGTERKACPAGADTNLLMLRWPTTSALEARASVMRPSRPAARAPQDEEVGETARLGWTCRLRAHAHPLASGRVICDARVMSATASPASIDETQALLDRSGYVSERSLATVLYLALKLGRPLFLEGEAGVGKTEIAKVLARGLGRKLIRLQCYEGLDVASAVYEWNYAGQMMAIRLAEAGGGVDRAALEADLFSERYLVRRPLLEALEPQEGGAPILLIDELDRTDEAFEAYLLEILSDFQVTVPELGTIRAAEPPIVIVTSNRTREIHDALKRRCLYHWVGYPDAARELAILERRVPGASARLSREVVAFVQAIREKELFKAPGIAETLDWAQALVELDAVALDPSLVADTLGVLLKYQDDIARMQNSEVRRMLDDIRAEASAA